MHMAPTCNIVASRHRRIYGPGRISTKDYRVTAVSAPRMMIIFLIINAAHTCTKITIWHPIMAFESVTEIWEAHTRQQSLYRTQLLFAIIICLNLTQFDL